VFFITGMLLVPAVWMAALFAVPGALIGLFVARRIYTRVSRELVLRAVAAILLLSGGSLILRAIH
jgi:uncharacterized membrane protein YfcA